VRAIEKLDRLSSTMAVNVLRQIGKEEEDRTECSETSAHKIRTRGNHPKKK